MSRRSENLENAECCIAGREAHPAPSRAVAKGVRVHSGTDPPGETTLDPWLDDPFPDYDTEPVVAFSAT